MGVTQECAECHGLGLVRTEAGSRACQCQEALQRAARLRRCGIPAAFESATFENFQARPSNVKAIAFARKMIETFIPGKSTLGLLLTGTVGVGKTHLASAIARELAETKGVEARFLDVRELLDRLRSSYKDDAQESQAKILRPLLQADLVVIDELGAAKPSDWVFETIELVIGGLYNRMAPVIVTTNLPNLPAGGAPTSAAGEYARAARQETLGDRIGMRMWSRLQQMTAAVDMSGQDMRGKR